MNSRIEKALNRFEDAAKNLGRTGIHGKLSWTNDMADEYKFSRAAVVELLTAPAEDETPRYVNIRGFSIPLSEINRVGHRFGDYCKAGPCELYYGSDDIWVSLSESEYATVMAAMGSGLKKETVMRYILLNAGELIKEGDEMYQTSFHMWTPLRILSVGSAIHNNSPPIRRKLWVPYGEGGKHEPK